MSKCYIFGRMVRFIYIIVLTFFMVWGITSRADIYKFVDKNGVAHFTNMPDSQQYTKIMSEEPRHKIKKSYSKNPSDYNRIIYSKSKKYNLEPSLIEAVIKVESNWNSTAVSQKGAIGLMQLMPFTARDMDVKNPFNPEENIEGGARYLRYLLDKFNGDLTFAIAAYNAGPGTIEKFGGTPPIPETQQYVRRVLSLYNGNDPDTSGSTRIYKIIHNDGTILYTNTPLSRGESKLSRL